jgi:predicted nucleic-acid-binding protein
MPRFREASGVVTFDTNVLVRILIGDDPAQTRLAERLFKAHATGDGIFVPLLVLAEVAWVLSGGYGLERAVIHERLTRLARTRGVFVEDVELVLDALSRYRTSSVDFADLLIISKASSQHALPLFTFDKKLLRQKGAQQVG